MDKSRVTMTDIAKLADVSTASVSYYLNGKRDKLGEKTCERIERTIRETGYVPNAQARTLAGKPSHVIAVIILDNTNIWAGMFLRGVEQVALEHDYQTIVCTSNFDPDTERMYVEKMLALGVEGFIVQPTANFRAVDQRITKAGHPVVFFDCSLYNMASTWIKTNLYDGVYDATIKLIDAGYEDFVTVAASITEMRTRMERFQGFTEALSTRGISYTPITIMHDSPTTTELEHYFTYKLHPVHRTLIFVQNQWALARTFKALQPLAHLIPERIGLIGINSTEWAELTKPSISTIVEPVEEEGRRACAMLLDLLGDNPPSPRQEVLECSVNWAGSTTVER